MRQVRQSRRTVRALAEQYGVSFAAIQKIRGRRSYKYVPDDPDQALGTQPEIHPGSDSKEGDLPADNVAYGRRPAEAIDACESDRSDSEPCSDTFLPQALRAQEGNNKWLTDEQVRAIRRSSQTSRPLADKFGIVQPTIIRVKNRLTYRHVPDLEDREFPPDGQYVRKYALDLLKGLPSGCCPTVVASPPLFSASNYFRPYLSRDEARCHFIQRQLRVIYECIRVAGDEGIVLYHTTRDVRSELLCAYERLGGARLPQIITWDHGKEEPVPHSAGNTDSYILVFRGESSAEGDIGENIWKIAASDDMLKWIDELEDTDDWARSHPSYSYSITFRQWYSSFRWWYSFPDELADRCISLGRGRVLDPFAGIGAIPMAAIRARRPWLACDNRAFLRCVFEQRKAEEDPGLEEC